MHLPQPIAGPVPRSFPDCANASASPLHTQAARARWVGLFVLLVLMVALLLPTPARASRVALVIGNAAYEGDGRLNNPINDARLIAATLRELKFDVVTPRNVAGNAVYENLDRESLQQAFIDFGKRAQKAEIVFVYYSGHGMRGPNGRNYLVPVKSVIESDDHIRVRAVPVDDLLDELGNTDDQLRIVVLDACRNNPFGDRKKGDGTKGLSRPTQRAGTLLAFATGDGKTAADGQEGNSPYAQALAQRLKDRADVKEVFDRVAEEVYDKTRRSQRPMKVDDVLGKHYLAGRPPTPGSATQVASVVPESVNPTARPGQAGGLSLDDLEKEETTRKEWAAWQARMKADYDKTAAFGGSADLRVKAWERFLGNYGQDNPLSREDEALRAQARQRQEGAQGEARQQAAVQQAQPLATQPLRPATPSAGQVINDCADCPEMVVIPAGSFIMGSNDGGSDEKPIHNVNIKPFALGKYEVTQGQWKAVMGSNPSKFSNCGDNCPVEQVNWDDIQQYIQKLNQKTGQRYRLPSEAEWEYAARAGTSSKYWWGDTASHEYANYGKEKCCDGLAQGRDRWENTAPVGQFPANAFGLHDMHGNVWERVQDWYHDNYSGAPVDGSAWETGGEQHRVLRGGSWNHDPAYLRSAIRFGKAPDFRIIGAGFRLARTAP